jgi:Na+/melibiose symporter-like transporter
MMLSIYPALGALLAAGFMFVYPLKESVLETISHELAVSVQLVERPDECGM